MNPYSRASMTCAFSNRALSLNGVLGLSKSSAENFLKHPQANLARRLICRVRSASSVMRPPGYTNWWTWLYFWLAASISSTGKGGVGVSSGYCVFRGARISRVSDFFSDTVKPNAPNTPTITVIILANPAGDLAHSQHRQHTVFSLPPSAPGPAVSRPGRPSFLRRGIPGPREWCRLR